MKKTRHQLIAFMKFSVLQLMLASVFVSTSMAHNVSAQKVLEQKISFDVKDEKLKSVLTTIEKLAAVKFSYSPQVIKSDRKVTYVAQDMPLGDVLRRLLPPLAISHQVVGKQILLQKIENRSINNSDFLSGISPALEKSRLTPPAFTVTGSVKDNKGEALIGASVALMGTSKGTLTDADGNYALALSDEEAKGSLVFSYVGYEQATLSIDGRTVIDVILQGDNALKEVVVVGYGTQERGKLSTSVSSLKGEQLKNLPISNVAQGLAGQVAGVFVQQGSGQPGAGSVIRIRGFGSINAGSEPLYVIDGFVCPDNSLFNSLNPNIVENIEILKDAAAGAIYGSRAANGVIIITTKHGKNGKTQFAFNTNTGTSNLIRKIEMMNRDQYIDIAKDALTNSGIAIPTILTGNTNQLPNTDWQDAIFDPAPFSNYQLSATGGTEKIRFFLSGNYLNQDGIVIRTGYKNYQLNANMDAQLNKRLKTGISFAPSFTRTQTLPTAGSVTGGGGYGGVGGMIQSALAMVPIIPVRTPDGDYGQVMKMGYQNFAINRIYNPVATAEGVDDITRQIRMVGRTYLDYQILEGLSANISFGGSVSSAYNSVFVAPFVAGEGSLLNTANISTPTYARSNASQSNTMVTNWLFEGLLTYQKTFGQSHHLKLDAGYSSQRNNFYQTFGFSAINDRGSANASNPQPAFSSDLVTNINGAALILGGGSLNAASFLSTFGRLNYDFKGKYLLQASLRRDGSSKFAPNNRYGMFPSIAAAWRLSEEAFMQKQDLIDNLKVRVSYGISGNDQIGNYSWLGRQSVNANYTFSNGSQQGIAKVSFENRDFRWEKNTQTNFGIDLGIFDSRINLTADYYVRLTEDMILSRPLPTENGVAGSVQANVGSMENRGIELSLNTRNTVGAFKWSSGVFFSQNTNKILSLVGGRPLLFGVAGYEGTGAFATAFRFEQGQSIGNVYGYNVIGIFNNQAEFDAYPKFGNSTIGNAKFEDVDGNKVIDANDIKFLGNVLPKFTYGITNNFRYKGFELNVIIDGTQGAKLFNPILRQVVLGRAFENSLASLSDRYRSPSSIGAGEWGIAKQNLTGGVNQPTSQYLFDASYLRFRNISLAYNLPLNTLEKLKIQTMNVFVSAQNYITLTKYFGYSPEANNYQGGAGGAQIGVDMGAYPLAKILTLGLNVGF
jgi:TonB-dependent starch-binding outer membrane protein SusC